MIRVLVADHDSTISNLATMRTVGYYRARGDRVDFLDNNPEEKRRPKPVLPMEFDGAYDVARSSCVFTWNADGARSLLNEIDAPVRMLGGPGIFRTEVRPVEMDQPDGSKRTVLRSIPVWDRLEPEIEATPPDYSIYPDDPYAVGFCNRGCLRNCDFCNVRKMEGLIDPAKFSPPWEWVPDDRNTALLLDNEFADYDPFTQEGVIRWFHEAGVKYALTQGYDLRIVARNPGLAGMLAANKPYENSFSHRCLYVAWDYFGIERAVRDGIEALLDAGFKSREIVCYMIVGAHTTRKQDLYRFDVLWKEYGVTPFAMPFNDRKDDKWLNNFVRFTQKRIFKKVDWPDYRYGRFSAADPPPEIRMVSPTATLPIVTR